jgi:hypothetical protein
LTEGQEQGWTGNCGNAAIAARLFFENVRLFLKNVWHFKDILIVFKTFSEKLRLFLINLRVFSKIARLSKFFFVILRFF